MHVRVHPSTVCEPLLDQGPVPFSKYHERFPSSAADFSTLIQHLDGGVLGAPVTISILLGSPRSLLGWMVASKTYGSFLTPLCALSNFSFALRIHVPIPPPQKFATSS